jgi:hypothetical protein
MAPEAEIVISPQSRALRKCGDASSAPARSTRSTAHERHFILILDGGQQRGTHGYFRELIEAITAFMDGWNDRCQPFVWTRDAETIIANAHRQSASGTRH